MHRVWSQSPPPPPHRQLPNMNRIQSSRLKSRKPFWTHAKSLYEQNKSAEECCKEIWSYTNMSLKFLITFPTIPQREIKPPRKMWSSLSQICDDNPWKSDHIVHKWKIKGHKWKYSQCSTTAHPVRPYNISYLNTQLDPSRGI